MRHWVGWPLVVFLVFLPVLFLLGQSLLEEGRPSLENYSHIFNRRVIFLFLQSLVMAFGAVGVAMALGGLMAAILETRWVTLRPFLRLLALAPLLFPPFMLVAAWRPIVPGWILGPRWGRVMATATILGFAYAPIIFFFASRGIRNISGDILDAARLQAGGRAVALKIILPLACPALFTGAALVFVLAFLDQETPALLLLPSTYAMEIFLQVGHGPGAAFATAAPAILLLGFLVAVANRWMRGRDFAVTGGGNPSAGPFVLGNGKGAILILVGLLVLLIGFPLARLFILVGSLSPFIEAFQLYRDAIARGIPVGLGTAAMAILLAALVLPRSGRPRPVPALLAWLPLAVPGTILGAGLIKVYNRPWLDVIYDSSWILVVGGAVRFFPIAYHALAAHLRCVPRELWETADLAGHSVFSRFLRVGLPLTAPGLVLGATSVLILASGELAASVLVAPPGHRPVPVVISAELHYNVDLEVPAALCVLQIASVLLMVGLVHGVGALAGRRLGQKA